MAHKLVSSNKPDQVRFGRLLQRQDGGDWNRKSVLKSWAISLTKTLERQLADEELGRSSGTFCFIFLEEEEEEEEEEGRSEKRKKKREREEGIGPPPPSSKAPRIFFLI